MCPRIVDFADGFTSATAPDIDIVTGETVAFKSYISDSAYVTDNGAPVGGEAYFNTTTDVIRFYNGTEWLPVGEQVVGIQERLGIGNGTNTGFTLTNAPLNNEALQIFVNGVLAEKSEYTITLPTVSFLVAPVVGSIVYASYLSNGTPASPIISAGTNNVIYHTVSGAEATAKQFTLPSTPSEPTRALVDVVDGSTQEYGLDFSITGAVFSWNGLGLDGLIADGDTLRVQYFT